jgi:TonB family protein
MESYLFYIGKAALAAGAFYIAYLALFQNRKQFIFNRIYLPVSLALSFIIPLITFTTTKYIQAPVADVNSFAYLSQSSVATESFSESYSLWPHYLFGMYLLGITGFLLHLLTGHFNAIRMVQKSRVRNLFGNRVHITQKDVHPFSFFSKIVLTEKTLNSPNLKMIVAHENIHVKEKHTLDILFTEILFLLQWFNPFAWLIKDAVKNNLEYKTDHEIVKTNDPQTYQLAMVALADKKGVAPFLTALNGSQLKNRIIMMKKKTENKFTLLKQLVLLPLLAVLVMGLSNREVNIELVQQRNTQLELNNVEQEGKTVKGKVTDKEGNPIKEVNILIVSSQSTVKTDSNGDYKIQLDAVNETLVFGKSGFKTLEIKTNGKNNIDVQLETENRLYIIDDKEFRGDLDAIDPDNIKSIDVLKGESGARHYGEKGKNGVIVIQTKSGSKPGTGKMNQDSGNTKNPANNNTPNTQSNLVKEIRLPEEMPEFPGGAEALKQYIARSLNYPESAKENGIQGRVYVTFRISKEGKVTDAKVARSIFPALDKEAVRVVSSLPDWNPGKQNGQPVEVVGYGIPVDFELKDYTPKVQSVASNLIVPGTLYIVDGKETTSIKDIPPDDIEKINVLNRASSAAIYGEKGKNGVIIIQTKNGINKSLQGKINNSKLESNPNSEEMKLKSPFVSEFPLFILDGKEVPSIDDVNSEKIEKIDVLKGESATELYGEKGKNGVIVITSKQKAEPNTITSELELRQFIAWNIKYPVEAQKANKTGIVQLFIELNNNGQVEKISEKASGNELFLDEVVVVAYKNEDADIVGNSPISNNDLLKNEAKRVFNLLQKVEIPQFKGKTVAITVKFMLQ